MKKKKFLSVVFIPMIILIVGVLSLATYFTVNIFQDTYLAEKKAQLESFTRVIVYSIQSQKITIDLPSLNKFCQTIGEKINARITIISNDGRVIFDNEKDPDSLENHGNRKEIQAALANKIGYSVRYSESLGHDMMYVSSPLRIDNEIKGVVRVSISLASIDKGISGVYNDVIWVGMGSVFLASLFAYLISKRISQPLKEMQLCADKFADNNFNEKIEPSEIEEINNIASSLNYMAMEVSKRIEALDAERAEKDIVLESMNEGVIAIDKNATIRFVNSSASKIFDYNEDICEGQLLHAAIRIPEIHQLVDSGFEDGTQVKESIVKLIISERSILVRVVPLRNNEGALLVFNDLTKIFRLERTRQDFVANVSHELRTPITSIMGFVETIIDQGFGDEKTVNHFLNIIREQSIRMAQIVDDLLVLSKLDSGLKPPKTTLPLSLILNSSRDACATLTNKKHISVYVDCKEDLEITCHSQLLEQAVVNLLTNAARYSDNNTSIKLSANLSEREIFITVEDEGIGIEEDMQEKIFERFYRVDKARSKCSNGTGLGLSIVKNIALIHRGHITVKSKIGEGSMFKLTLPKA